jgi:hypothetical protein
MNTADECITSGQVMNESYLLQLIPCEMQCLLCHQRGSNAALLYQQHQQRKVLCLYLCESAASQQVDEESQNDERHGEDLETLWQFLQSDGCL